MPPSISIFGIGATPHLPDWSAWALTVPVIQTPVTTAATSPEVKEPTHSVQPAVGL